MMYINVDASGGTVNNENISNKELAEDLRKPIIKKFEQRKVHSFGGADHADMQLISKFNTYHSTIKMKTADIKSSTYIDSSKEINDEDPKFKIGDIVRISKYKKKPFLKKAMFLIGLKKFL